MLQLYGLDARKIVCATAAATNEAATNRPDMRGDRGMCRPGRLDKLRWARGEIGTADKQ